MIDDDGTRVRVVCGEFWGKSGPVDGVAADPRYLDVSVPPGERKTLPVETYAPRVRVRLRGLRHVPRRVRSASGQDRSASAARRSPPCATTSAIDRSCCSIAATKSTVQAGEQGIRFLLVSGKPIEEPVAWYGPIVMNTQDELRQAVAELNRGTFIKQRYAGSGFPRTRATGRTTVCHIKIRAPDGSLSRGARHDARRSTGVSGLERAGRGWSVC